MDRKKSIAWVIAGVLPVVLFWYLGGRAVAVEAIYPVEKSAGFLSRHVWRRAKALWGRQKLAAQNATLKREVAALALVRQDNEVLQAENARLRKALGFQAKMGGQWMAGAILARGGATGCRDFLRVGLGKSNGVVPGAAVVSPDGLVGRVTSVSPHTCEVLPISDPSVKIACAIDSGDETFGGIRGIVSGCGTVLRAHEGEATIVYFPNPLRIRHVRRNPVLPPRALVRTTGEGGVFPAGIPVGYLIDGTVPDGSRLEREGDIIPAVDFSELTEVFIRREN